MKDVVRLFMNSDYKVIKKGEKALGGILPEKKWNLEKKLHKTKNSYLILNKLNSKKRTISVRNLSKRNAVPMGRNLDSYTEDLLIVCSHLDYEPGFLLSRCQRQWIKPLRKLKMGLLAIG